MVETVLRTHNNKIEDAIESLHALSLGDTIARNESQGLDSAMMGNNDTGPAQSEHECMLFFILSFPWLLLTKIALFL